MHISKQRLNEVNFFMKVCIGLILCRDAVRLSNPGGQAVMFPRVEIMPHHYI